MSSNFINCNADFNCGSGQFGQTVYVTSGANLTQIPTTDFSKYYNKYVINATANIDFTLGSLVTPGFSCLVINIGTFNITFKSQIATLKTLRQNSYIEVIAENTPDVWLIKTVGTLIDLASGTSPPVSLLTDIAGDLYVDKTNSELFIYDGTLWKSIKITVDPLSIDGDGSSLDPYVSIADLSTFTAAEDISAYAPVSLVGNQLVNSRKISYTSTINQFDNVYRRFPRTYSESIDVSSIYSRNGESIFRTLQFSGSITPSPRLDGLSVTYTAIGARAQLLVMNINLNGYINWITQVTATLTATPSSVESLQISVASDGTILVPLYILCGVGFTGSVVVVDPYGTSTTITGLTGTLGNALLLTLNSTGTLKNSYLATGVCGFYRAFASSSGDIYLSGFVGFGGNAQFNTEASRVAFTFSVPGAQRKPFLAKINATTDRFEYVVSSANNVNFGADANIDLGLNTLNTVTLAFEYILTAAGTFGTIYSNAGTIAATLSLLQSASISHYNFIIINFNTITGAIISASSTAGTTYAQVGTTSFIRNSNGLFISNYKATSSVPSPLRFYTSIASGAFVLDTNIGDLILPTVSNLVMCSDETGKWYFAKAAITGVDCDLNVDCDVYNNIYLYGTANNAISSGTFFNNIDAIPANSTIISYISSNGDGLWCKTYSATNDLNIYDITLSQAGLPPIFSFYFQTSASLDNTTFTTSPGTVASVLAFFLPSIENYIGVSSSNVTTGNNVKIITKGLMNTSLSLNPGLPIYVDVCDTLFTPARSKIAQSNSFGEKKIGTAISSTAIII